MSMPIFLRTSRASSWTTDGSRCSPLCARCTHSYLHSARAGGHSHTGLELTQAQLPMQSSIRKSLAISWATSFSIAIACFVYKVGRFFLKLSNGPRHEKASLQCPLGGCRAPQLASGCFAHLAASSYEVDVAHVLSFKNPDPKIEEAEPQQKNHSIMATDISLVRAQVSFALEFKLDAWRRLPLQLAGLAHSHAAVRKDVAKQVLEAFDLSLQQGASLRSQHPLSRLFLEDAGPHASCCRTAQASPHRQVFCETSLRICVSGNEVRDGGREGGREREIYIYIYIFTHIERVSSGKLLGQGFTEHS